ncbi:hypothetical protein CUU64_15230 [Bacillus sp. V5-8f]|nr:hypothetical protein CUU64_15230 [Bacillus sp. V5-8f]
MKKFPCFIFKQKGKVYHSQRFTMLQLHLGEVARVATIVFGEGGAKYVFFVKWLIGYSISFIFILGKSIDKSFFADTLKNPQLY